METTGVVVNNKGLLANNIYRVWWRDPREASKDRLVIREYQIQAVTKQTAINKVNRVFGIPKSKIGATLILRKGQRPPYGARITKW